LKMDYNHTFGQVKPHVDLVVIEDAKKNFNWYAFYNLINSDWSVNSKGNEVKTIPFKLAPKLMFNTNYIFGFNNGDESTRRRFAEYKLTDFFNEGMSPSKYFAESEDKEVRFFDDWDIDEWNRFYSYIFRCFQDYMEFGIMRIEYDKSEDQFRRLFGFEGEPKYDEFKRIWDSLIKLNQDKYFTVTDFAEVYNNSPLKHEKFFTVKNTKNHILEWIRFHKIQGVTYNSRRQFTISSDYNDDYNEIPF